MCNPSQCDRNDRCRPLWTAEWQVDACLQQLLDIRPTHPGRHAAEPAHHGELPDLTCVIRSSASNLFTSRVLLQRRLLYSRASALEYRSAVRACLCLQTARYMLHTRCKPVRAIHKARSRCDLPKVVPLI